MATSAIKEQLKDFVVWAATHITGDEKGEAQIFLDRMFRGFGWAGFKEAGATCEKRVKNDNGGTSFADLVWKPVVVIEMKKRGTDLSKHYRQAFDYWTYLVPQRPRYAVLCNFDEFWVYDFNSQMDIPVDKVKLQELHEDYGPLNFMFPGDAEPIFGNHQESVTRDAADKLATCFNLMVSRGIERPLAQRFILQMLMALFAQDIGLIEKYFVTKLISECKNPSDTYDKLGGLFAAMNTSEQVKGGRYKGIAYFNGGLFAEPARVELTDKECLLLKQAAEADWSKVRPEIFGTLFERSLDSEQRHAYGAHYTSPVDIMKIVGPTIVDPWRERIESATTLTQLRTLLSRLTNFTVLDPACGSGNFLYIAYREIKRLESRIYERMSIDYKTVDARQKLLSFVTARNFFGLDINPFAVEIAKATMMLAHKLSIDELHINEEALPLDNLDANFRVGDALINSDGSKVDWPITDVVIGNPPFLGAKLVKRAYGTDYVNAVRKAYPEIPGMADFCVYWFRKAHDRLKHCSASDPFSGRAGLVGTQSIRSNASRIGGLDYIAETGTIIEAVDDQPWSGEAVVHVSIVNWVNSQETKLLPKLRRLWFKSSDLIEASKRKSVIKNASKQIPLDMRLVRHINSSLSDKTDVSQAMPISINETAAVVCQGITPGHSGFILSETERDACLVGEPKNAAVIHPYLVGNDVLGNHGKASRYIIDFGHSDILRAQKYHKPFLHIKNTVLPTMKEAAKDQSSERAASLDSWWIHWRARADLIKSISKLSRYLVCSRVTKRPLFAFVSSEIRPGDALQVFSFEDDYSFGILQSKAHYMWFHAKCSNFKSDPRYTSESVFHTFPWPQAPTQKQVNEIAEAGREIRRIRALNAEEDQCGLRALYGSLDLPGKNPLRSAHEALDRAVEIAYGFSSRRDILQQLLDLNSSVVSAIKLDKPATAPGIPEGYKIPKRLVTDDCIEI